ncbi:hypothetical protein ACQ4PT_034196 [Festuca glaucescens]
MPPPSRPRKRSRGGRATEAAAAEADALISLPRDVLDEILTRLGILDAVHTSALSRAWRRRWEALPSLDLSFPRLEDDKGAPKGLGAVDSILLRCPGRVRLFRADIDEHYAGRVHDWLHVLPRRGVEILDLDFDKGFPALPTSVFFYGRLTSLSLFGCAIPLLPAGVVAFPELRKLSLVNVREWVIQAPNLRHFTICSEINYGWVLEDLTSLRSAVIDLWDFVVDSKFAKFLLGVVQVRKLLVVTCNAPIYDEEEQKFEADKEFQNALWTDGMCANLQAVQMTGINWRRNEMVFIELILSKARLLHTLSISHGEKIVMPSEDALNELLRYKRASTEAQVLFKGKET